MRVFRVDLCIFVRSSYAAAPSQSHERTNLVSLFQSVLFCCEVSSISGAPGALHLRFVFWFEKQNSRIFLAYFPAEMGKGSSSATFCEILLAILLPPLGVFFRYGCGLEFWISILLTILGYIPGILYALYVIVA